MNVTDNLATSPVQARELDHDVHVPHARVHFPCRDAARSDLFFHQALRVSAADPGIRFAMQEI